jgi:tRNA(Arg) A34 adenosine deaminase TadA
MKYCKRQRNRLRTEINVLLKLPHKILKKVDELVTVFNGRTMPMCMSAIIWAGIGSVIYGADISICIKFGNQININQ